MVTAASSKRTKKKKGGGGKGKRRRDRITVEGALKMRRVLMTMIAEDENCEAARTANAIAQMAVQDQESRVADEQELLEQLQLIAEETQAALDECENAS